LGRQRALRSGHWKLVLNPAAQGNIADPVLLYNLRADPGEQTNLASEQNRSTENLRTLADLRSELLALMTGMGVPETTVDEYRGNLQAAV
jgi:arylsulfatase A-like enzyme